MDSTTALLQIAVILILARVFGEIAGYFQIPTVIGEILAGVMLGPSLLGLIQPDELIRVFAEVGIILLLFQIGLETNIGNLIKTGAKSVVVAIGGFFLPFMLCFALSFYGFGINALTSLMIAGTMTATSIGITMRSMKDIGQHNSKEGQIILGAAVLDDIMGVILLAILFDFSQTARIDLTSASRIILFMVVFFLVAPTVAKAISYLIRRYEPQSTLPGLVPTTIVSLVLFLAWLSHAIGIPELLGGFATGLALSRRFVIPFGIALRVDEDFSNHVHQQMKPIIQLFTPIFFVSVGLSLNLSQIDWASSFFWFFSLSMTALAIVSKLGGSLLIKEKLARKVVIGLAMVPRGEVGLVFAELGRTAGLFNHEIYATIVIVIAYTTLFTPFWLRQFYKQFGHQLKEE